MRTVGLFGGAGYFPSEASTDVALPCPGSSIAAANEAPTNVAERPAAITRRLIFTSLDKGPPGKTYPDLTSDPVTQGDLW